LKEFLQSIKPDKPNDNDTKIEKGVMQKVQAKLFKELDTEFAYSLQLVREVPTASDHEDKDTAPDLW
jgi:hypothetical protein